MLFLTTAGRQISPCLPLPNLIHTHTGVGIPFALHSVRFLAHSVKKDHGEMGRSWRALGSVLSCTSEEPGDSKEQ